MKWFLKKVFMPGTLGLLMACSVSRKDPLPVAVTPMVAPVETGSGEPNLFTDGGGKTYLTWIEENGDSSKLKYAILQEEVWSEPKEIIKGVDWFINWADYPAIAVTKSQAMMAHILQRSGEGTYAYDVKLIASADGTSWNNPLLLHNDGKQAEHGFVTLVPYGNNFFAAWLDGRNTVSEEMEDHEGHHGAMSIRAAMLDAQGNKIEEWELDNKTCDCCQTTAAITANGPVVLYRNRSDEEIRDIAIVRWIDNQWTSPKIIYPDNWKIAGCPVNGPRVDAIGNHLSVAWFTAKQEEAMVYIIFSSDGGETFGEAVRVDEGKTIGRVDLVMLDENRAAITWMEGQQIKMRIVHSDGKKEEPVIIATTSDSRSSGFPQMTRAGNTLIFAWTDDAEAIIKTASLSL